VEIQALSATLPVPGDDVPKPKNIAEAAQQFEALLLGQMLKDVGPQNPEDPTAEPMWDMAAQQFAQVLSKNGGFGLAKLIAGGLEHKTTSQ
jgi:Rod binding domain-containing protein